MADPATIRLRRLTRVTKLLYREEMAELARLSAAVGEVATSAAAAEHYLNEEAQFGSFLSELALARAGRMRKELEQAESRRQAQVEVATEALTKAKGADCRVAAAVLADGRAASVRALEEIIERRARPKSSLR